MFYQISNDGPGRFSRCWNTAKFVNFMQASEMTLNDLWPQIYVNWDNTSDEFFIWTNDIDVLYCT